MCLSIRHSRVFGLEILQILNGAQGHKHGVSIQSSINLGDTLSANNARRNNSKNLILGEVVYISIIYRIPDSNEAGTQKEKPDRKSTLLGFRHGIERYLNSPPYNKGLQLASDLRFLRSNQLLDAQLINLKRNGKENVTHKPAIEEDHLQQLKASDVFLLSSPLSQVRNFLVSYCSFLLPKRPRRTRSSVLSKRQLRC